MAMTAPGMRPASISAFNTASIRASRSEERPTSSGLARGRGSSASAAPEAKRPSAATRMRKAVMNVSHSGSSALVVHQGRVRQRAGGGQRGFLLASMLRRRRVAVGGEFAVLDGVFVLLVAIIDRPHGAVGLHHETVFAGLLQVRE